MSNTNTDTAITDAARAEEIAHVINKYDHHALAVRFIDQEAEREGLMQTIHRLSRDVEADDERVKPLLQEMYDVMVNHSSAHLWSNFVDSIDGMPDFGTKTYSGVVTLKFYFSEVEVAGDLADWEVENAILEEIRGDLYYGYEDEREVEFDEE